MSDMNQKNNTVSLKKITVNKMSGSEKDDDLPPNWIKRYSKIQSWGKPYYVNLETKETSWLRPNKSASADDSLNRWKRPKKSSRDEHSLNRSSLMISRKNDTNLDKNCSTPAQKRLQDLQKDLARKQIEKGEAEFKGNVKKRDSKSLAESELSKRTNKTDTEKLKINRKMPSGLLAKTCKLKDADHFDKTLSMLKNENATSPIKSLSKSTVTQTKYTSIKSPIQSRRKIENSVSPEQYSRLKSPIKSYKLKTSANDRLKTIRDSVQRSSFGIESTNVESDSLLPSCSEDVTMRTMNEEHTVATNYTEPEKMDWDDEEILQEISLIRSKDVFLSEENSSYNSGINTQTAALSEKLSCTVIVIDTNIFLSHMIFLVNLMDKVDEIPGNPKLVIPYIVLQELDKLKTRTERAISLLASRAIKFIHEQLKLRKDKILGQSAIDHRKKLIDIDNSDDNILNCCLQYKQTYGHVILLTNDVNLRNKSICSQIESLSKGEFQTKLFDSNAR